MTQKSMTAPIRLDSERGWGGDKLGSSCSRTTATSYADMLVQQLFSNWQPVARGLRDALLTKTKRPRIRSQAERATRVTRAASHIEEPIADEDARFRDAKEG